MSAAEEAVETRRELEAVMQAHSEAQSLIEVANGELQNYKLKICNLEAGISLKD